MCQLSRENLVRAETEARAVLPASPRLVLHHWVLNAGVSEGLEAMRTGSAPQGPLAQVNGGLTGTVAVGWWVGKEPGKMEIPSTAKRRRILPEGRSREGGGTKKVGLWAVGFGFCKPGSRSLHACVLTGAGVQESDRLTAGGNWRRERRGSERRCRMASGRHKSLPGGAPPHPHRGVRSKPEPRMAREVSPQPW